MYLGWSEAQINRALVLAEESNVLLRELVEQGKRRDVDIHNVVNFAEVTKQDATGKKGSSGKK